MRSEPSASNNEKEKAKSNESDARQALVMGKPNVRAGASESEPVQYDVVVDEKSMQR